MELYRVRESEDCEKTKWGKSEIFLSFSTGTSGRFLLSQKQFNAYIKVRDRGRAKGYQLLYVVLNDGYFVWCSDCYEWMIKAFNVPQDNVYLDERPDLDSVVDKLDLTIPEDLLDED